MAEDKSKASGIDPIAYIKETGGVFRFGTGVLGKSAIALGILLVGIAIAVSRLHADAAIIAVIVIGVVVFLGWLGAVLNFATKHPDAALLEGAEWTGFQRFQAAAKGFIPKPEDKQLTILPGASPSLTSGTADEHDKEIGL